MQYHSVLIKDYTGLTLYNSRSLSACFSMKLPETIKFGPKPISYGSVCN